MNFIDYRKKLGLSFSNSDKMKMFKQKSLFLLKKYQSFNFNDINKCLGNINHEYRKPNYCIGCEGRFYLDYEIVDFFKNLKIWNFYIIL